MSEEIKSLKDYISTTKNEIFTTFKIETISNLIIYYEDLQQKVDRLNNIIKELEWKSIEQYEKPKYDWVLVKYFIEPDFECIPCVAEKRFDKWYDRNDNLINGEIRYFFDMQQLDKLKELKEDNNGKI